MTDTGLVVVFRGPRQKFEFMEFPVPEPAPGDVVVKIRLANVCGSDLHAWRGEYDITRGQQPPYCLSIGHEMSGEVYRLGEGVTTDSAGQPLRVGDRIAYQYFCGCGVCPGCRRKTTPRCVTGMQYRLPPTEFPNFNGAYGQFYYLRKPQARFKIPENVPDTLAGPANCALAQVIDGLSRVNAGPGDQLVIQGAGGLGINAIAVAKKRQVSKIIVIDGIESRLALAREFGADETISLQEYPTPESRIARVRALTDGWGADYVMELVGHAALIPEGVEMLCTGGTYLEIGTINQKQRVEMNPSAWVHGGKTIRGLMWYEKESLQEALALLSRCQHKYPFHKILSHQYPLTAVNEAFHDQDAGHVQRAALLPWAT